MKRLSPLFILLLIVFLSASIPATAEDPNLLENIVHKEPRKIILDNGLTVIIKEVSSSGLVSIDARVKAGSACEGNLSGSGISHFVEHMIFKDTRERRGQEIEKKIRSLGGTINGATAYDYTSFAITVPNEHLSLALEILSDSLFNANMDPAELKRERNVILKEIKLNRDIPIKYLSQRLWSTVFKSHPYRQPIIGHENLFRKLARKDLLKYHNEMYVPNNMTLVVVGDIRYDSAATEIKKYFQHIERGYLKKSAFAQEKPQISKRVLEIEQELEMAYYALGYRSVDVHSPDMPALDLLSVILGGGESSRLNSSVYRKKNLVYSVGSWNYTPYDPGIFIISGVAEPKKLRSALGAIREEIQNIKRGGVEDQELQRAKSLISSNYIYLLETLSRQAHDLAVNEILAGDFNYTKKYLKDLDAVTKDDIKRAARLYLNDDSLSIVTLSPHRKEPPAKPKEDKKAQSDIQKFTLPNGLRCLLKEDHDLPIVSMIAVCQGGLRAEREEDCGISNLTALMMLKGTASKSEEEISNLVETMGANLSFFSGNNTLGIRCNLLSRDLDNGLELFEDIILNPSFPEEIFQREKDSITAAIKATDDDIFRAGMKAFKETLFRKHPYRFQTIGTIDSVKNLTRDDLEKFHKRYFIPNNMALAIFGDIDIKILKEEIDKKFGPLKKSDMPEFTAISEPGQSQIRQGSRDIQKEQSLIIMGFKGTTVEQRDRYILQLINTALSGISGRLSARLREELGIAYAVGSFSVPAVDPGYFALYAATTSDNIELAKKEFLRQIKLLNKKGLAEEKIDSAKKQLIGNQRIKLQGNTSLAYQTVLDELYGLGYNNYLDYAKLINSITNADIIEVSRRYLKPNAHTLIIIEGKSGI